MTGRHAMGTWKERLLTASLGPLLLSSLVPGVEARAGETDGETGAFIYYHRIEAGEPMVDGDPETQDLELYRVAVTGGDEEQLTVNDVDDANPALSPDRTRLAFGRDGDIWLIELDTFEETQLTATEDFEKEPSWSRDGTRLAFAWSEVGGGDPKIDIMRTDGTERRTIPLDVSGTGPEWSPRRGRIAFTGVRPRRGSDVYTVGLQGQNLRNLTTGRVPCCPLTARMGAWSPDGEKIAFLERSQCGSVAFMRADGGAKRFPFLAKNNKNKGCKNRLLTHEDVEWSPNGRRVAFIASDDTGECGGPRQLVTMNARTTLDREVLVRGCSDGGLGGLSW